MQNKTISIVNIVGINDINCVHVKHNKGSIGTLELEIPGNNNFLQEHALSCYSIHTLILGGEKMNIDIHLPKDPVWFNSISNPDTNRYSLKKLCETLEHISVPIINHPEHILSATRDGLGDLLSGIEGVVVPKCIKIVPNSKWEIKTYLETNPMAFPLLFRALIEDGEGSFVKLDSIHEFHKLERFAFDGGKAYYMTEFREYISPDKYYRKMRFLVIGGKVIARHLMLSPSWQIHTESPKGDKMLYAKTYEEEKVFLSKPHTHIVKLCREIQKRLKLDCFGIDCAVDAKGRLIIFEANAHTMTGIGKRESYHNGTLSVIDDALKALIEQNLKASSSK